MNFFSKLLSTESGETLAESRNPIAPEGDRASTGKAHSSMPKGADVKVLGRSELMRFLSRTYQELDVVLTGGHGLTRPLTATTKTPRRANKQPLRTCLTGFWMRFHSDKGISGLRLVEAVRVTQSTLADGPSEHRTISLDSC